MKKLENKALFFLVVTAIMLGGCTASSPVRQVDSEKLLINQIGYPLGGPKKALSKAEAEAFILIDQEGNTVFEGKTKPARTWELSGDSVSELDFSSFDQEGTYRICVGEECSYLFRIAAGVYDELADAAMRPSNTLNSIIS